MRAKLRLFVGSMRYLGCSLVCRNTFAVLDERKAQTKRLCLPVREFLEAFANETFVLNFYKKIILGIVYFSFLERFARSWKALSSYSLHSRIKSKEKHAVCDRN